MIVHSDAVGSMVFFLVMVVSALMLVVALMALAGREFRFAGRIVGWWSAGFVAYAALTIAVSLVLPGRRRAQPLDLEILHRGRQRDAAPSPTHTRAIGVE